MPSHTPNHIRLFPPPRRQGRAQTKRKENKGFRVRHVLTGNGDVRIKRRYLWCKDQGGCCPADLSLGVDEYGFSPRVREACSAFATTGSFQRAMKLVKRFTNIPISTECLRRVVEHEASLIAAGREDASIPPSFTAADAKVQSHVRFYSGMDGFFIPMVTQSEKVKRRNQVETTRAAMSPLSLLKLVELPERKKGHADRYKEMKLCVFYTQGGVHKHTSVTSGDSKRAGVMLKNFAGQLGFHKADERIGIVDGAAWIKLEMETNLPTLSMMVLDIFHLCEHVYAAAEICMGASPAAKAWAQDRMEEFKTRGAAEPLAAMNTLLKSQRAKSKRKALSDLINYIEKRLEMLQYPQAKARGWDIGSGPTEAQCKTHATRLKISGAKWDPENASAMLNLIALEQSGQWDSYWARKAA